VSFRIAIFHRLLAALRCGLALPAIALSLGLAACDPQPPMTANTLQQPSQNTQTLRMAEYRVAPGDRVRVVVLSDPELSGEYEIDSAGMISPRMAGRVQVVGMTTAEIEELLRTRYRTDGLLRVARLSVDLVARRPFYILGEVGRPGSFPYVSGINVAQAIAIAGGFTRRASKARMTIQRFNQTQGMEESVTEDSPVGPGDIIRVPERWF
jgi:protein involved in polysaccharide export with SLBB domain